MEGRKVKKRKNVTVTAARECGLVCIYHICRCYFFSNQENKWLPSKKK